VRVRPPWPATYALDLGDIGYTVQPGHRLRLELGCGEFPRYLPQAPAGVDPWFSDPREWPTNEVSLHLGGSEPTTLNLHVLSPGSKERP
jgi:predicted acyl esterase